MAVLETSFKFVKRVLRLLGQLYSIGLSLLLFDNVDFKQLSFNLENGNISLVHSIQNQGAGLCFNAK